MMRSRSGERYARWFCPAGSGLFPATIVLILVAAFAATWPAQAADTRVDLELVLAVDVSGSMDHDEQVLQRNGYVEAIAHPDVVSAIAEGMTGQIALTYLEWAGPASSRVTIPWRTIAGRADAEAFAAELAAAPLGTMRGTSISNGLFHAAQLFDRNGYDGYRKVIDVSGDGPNNMGPPVIPTRDQVLALGIVINGLPIMLKRRDFGYGTINDLDTYYENCVIGGPGAFLVPVRGREELIAAIRRKLILEIADSGAGFAAIAALPVQSPGYDCMVGEKQRRMWMDP